MDDFKLDTEYVGFEIEFRYVWRSLFDCNFDWILNFLRITPSFLEALRLEYFYVLILRNKI